VRRLVLALDQGTTGSAAIVFDDAGRPASSVDREIAQHFPRPGWVEHDALEIWSTTMGVAAEALVAAGAGPGEVAAVGITNQRETTVVWDRATGEPVHRAIVWQDRRTAALCDRMRADGLEPLVRERTGLVCDPYFSGTKLSWLLDEVPGARARAERGELAFGTIDSWLVFKLTGGRVHATDATNASRTLLFDIRRGRWDDDLLGYLGVPRAMLPDVVPSVGRVGETAGGLPLPAGAPIAGIAGDQQAALVGQACFAPGMAKNTYGTGCFALLKAGDAAVVSGRGLLTTVAANGGYALEGAVFVAGAAVQWLRDGLGIIAQAADTEALARSVPDTGGVYFVPAFVGLGAPHWDPYARGTLIGLTRGTTRAHLARAALEAIAYQSRDVLSAMEADAGAPLRELRVDGGAAANDFLMQFQADLLDRPVVRPSVLETTAQGAAYLAGLGAGLWRDEAEVARLWRAGRRFEPAMPASVREALLEAWGRAVERSRRWVTP
jgi:glycerol kinase